MSEIKEAIEIADNKISAHNIPAGILKITNYYDNVLMLHKINPFFYDKSKVFWVWSKEEYRWDIVDETDILVMIDERLSFGGQLTTTKVKSNYLEAFKQVGRSHIPKDAPKTWVQFKDQIIDVETKKTFKATSEFFICNPIPYSLGESSDTPIIDKLFKDWVGEGYDRLLYEILAYCCLPDYPIHRIFCLVGSGRNGKSQFQKIIYKFLGTNNVASASLDKLASPQQRFESIKLFKKLACLLGETNFGTMENTSMLKQLSGGDAIDFEFKMKNGFTAMNYAKIIINSNSLPNSLDTSDGFYRRWLIINFPNEFPEGKDIIATIPEEEYNNLSRKCLEMIPELIDKGCFVKEGTIEERKEAYIMASNPLPFFIKSFCDVGDDLFVKANDLYSAYVQFLISNKKRKVSKKEFYSTLTDEGLIAERTNKRLSNGNYIKTNFVEGIELITNWKIKIHEICNSQNSQKPLNTTKDSLRREESIKTVESDYFDYKYIKESNQNLKVLSRDVIFHLERFGDKGIMEIEQLKEDLGIDDIFVDNLLEKGLVFQPTPSTIKKL